MTTTYDPHHPLFSDEADVRGELSRVFDICAACRLCLDRCDVFPTLFGLLDAMSAPDRAGPPAGLADAGRLTPDEQDRIADGCVQCGRCVTACPSAPERDRAAALDMPRLMLRVAAMRHAAGHDPLVRRTAAQVLGRNRVERLVLAGRTGSWRRRLAAAVTGIAATVPVPPPSSPRLSTWLQGRGDRPATGTDTGSDTGSDAGNRTGTDTGNRTGNGTGTDTGNGTGTDTGTDTGSDAGNRTGTGTGSDTGRAPANVAVLASCVVEHRAAAVGRELVEQLERDGARCDLSGAGCCGAVWLHAGVIGRFARVAERNVATLAAELGAGATAIVVPDAGCARAVRDYPRHVGPDRRDDAAVVAAHVHDPVELGVAVATRARGGGRLVVIATGDDARAIAGDAATVVEGPPAPGSVWGLRSRIDPARIERVASQLAALDPPLDPTTDAVACTCALTSAALTPALVERFGITPVHPVSIGHGEPPGESHTQSV